MLHHEIRFPWLLLAAIGASGLLLLNPSGGVIQPGQLSAAALPQAATTGLLRMGDFARTLSDKDIGDIEGIALAAGGKPWLLEGPVGQLGFSIRAYLPAETQTPELRRGRAIILVKRPGESTWTKQGSAQPIGYAQVPPARGAFNTFTGEEDLNRPFPLSGSFDDTEILSLVAFIRSKPNNLQGDWPILAMDRQRDNSISVAFRQGGNLLGRAIFRKEGPPWVIVSSRGGGRA